MTVVPILPSAFCCRNDALRNDCQGCHGCCLQGFELKRRGELKLIKVFQSEV